MITVQTKCLSLDAIYESGQCFRWTPCGAGYRIAAKNRILHAYQDDAQGSLRLDCTPEEFEACWKAYFDLDTDYAAIIRRIPENDGYLKNAAAYGQGIRILRQEPWETLITFILSQRKNIPAIRQTVEKLCAAGGRVIGEDEGEPIYAFPTPKEICTLTPDALKACGLGYRAEYVRRTAEAFCREKIRTESFTLNKNADVEKETASGSSYIYKYVYDGNGNWLQKDSYYEDGGDEIKYSRPLLRSKRSIQYNGSYEAIVEPAILFAFDAGDDDTVKSIADSQEDTEVITDDDASKVPSESFLNGPFTSVKIDPMDDRQTLYLVFNAQEKVNDYSDNVSLIIRKKQGTKPEVYINWKEFLNHGRCLVTYRIDDGKARTEEWTLSTDEKASFHQWVCDNSRIPL